MADPSGEARTAVEQSAAAAAAAAPVIPDRRKRQPTVGPVRYNLEAFGVAILGAVLLKWFCLEAFQIPTSSMQPTLMGSSEAGVQRGGDPRRRDHHRCRPVSGTGDLVDGIGSGARRFPVGVAVPGPRGRAAT